MVGSFLTSILAGNGVQTINDFGFQRLLNDITALERFAENSPVQNIGENLAQCRQICNIITAGKVHLSCTVQLSKYHIGTVCSDLWCLQLEDTLDPQKLKQAYPNVDIGILVLAMDKYRNISRGMSKVLPSRVKKTLSKKKNIEAVTKKLRESMFRNDPED